VEGTGHRPDPLRQGTEGTVDGDQPQDPPAAVTQMVVSNPRGSPDPPIEDRKNRNTSSRSKRAVNKVKKFLKSESVSKLQMWT